MLEQFADKLIVFLDRASYVRAKNLLEFVGGNRSVESIDGTDIACDRGENLRVWDFPSQLAELNPVERYWHRFKAWYELIETLHELESTRSMAANVIDEPGLFPPICST